MQDQPAEPEGGGAVRQPRQTSGHHHIQVSWESVQVLLGGFEEEIGLSTMKFLTIPL